MEIEDLKRAAWGKTHFFDEETTRFFNSKYYHPVQTSKTIAYFITSDRNAGHYYSYSEGRTISFDDGRLYTVRKMFLRSGRIETIGNFQGHTTLAQARKALAKVTGRKVKKQFYIESYYGRWETETAAESMTEARELLRDYRENTNAPVRVKTSYEVQ